MTDHPTARPASGESTSFLPNLCAPQAVLLLVLVAELLAVLLAMINRGLAQLSWDAIALYSFLVQWIVLVSAVLLCRLQPRLNRCTPVRAGALSYGLVLAVTVIFSLLGQWLLQAFLGAELRLDGWQLAENLLAAAILAGIGLRYLYLQQQLRNQQQAELSARIQALQSRIRPHFLFNSLNSIASLIATAPDRAERAVEDLAGLFRASLAEPALIPLKRELALCRGYLAMEQLRLGDRLRVDWHLDELPESTPIPALLLQPLLENAVFHGIEPRPEGGDIQIQIARSGNQVAIRIDNPLPAGRHPEQARQTNRMALDNVRHRLQAHFGPAARLSERREGGRFTLIITYPTE
ncbi:two-component system sensor histidine kinase AlgZ [Marinimicrobium koreense]|uniref:Two-component system sensor histidine kinase AlgZ n=1 Tax=Marinimicrobium koreense TaxID=306545 RepID=A0A3N1P4Y7_9GAMM|nr:sensor histidine kinase [Marinimicrobium koreense]ROQ21780.1 two-component system sensor histidine kinase AlgZ [Marinimicrobium koreense]